MPRVTQSSDLGVGLSLHTRNDEHRIILIQDNSYIFNFSNTLYCTACVCMCVCVICEVWTPLEVKGQVTEVTDPAWPDVDGLMTVMSLGCHTLERV